MTLTANQQLELNKPVTRIVYFAEFSFLSATVYVSSLGQTVTWGGHEWVGLGAISNISAINEELGTSASSLTFTLNIAQIELLALATGDVAEYRGRDAKLYFCPMDEQFRLIDTPVICWRGSMDTMSSSISGGRGSMDTMSASVSGGRGESTGSISLQCETSAYGLKRRQPLRLNAAQQKQKYPLDTGFDYLTDLLGNPDATIWLTKRFQS
jgi:hypothetical protein